MYMRLQVFWTCAIRTPSCSYITHLAGRNPDGTRWELPADDAIRALDGNRLSLYVIRNGHVDDVVAGSFEGHSYLKCSSDDRVPARLLDLPAFEPCAEVGSDTKSANF